MLSWQTTKRQKKQTTQESGTLFGVCPGLGCNWSGQLKEITSGRWSDFLGCTTGKSTCSFTANKKTKGGPCVVCKVDTTNTYAIGVETDEIDPVTNAKRESLIFWLFSWCSRPCCGSFCLTELVFSFRGHAQHFTWAAGRYTRTCVRTFPLVALSSLREVSEVSSLHDTREKISWMVKLNFSFSPACRDALLPVVLLFDFLSPYPSCVSLSVPFPPHCFQ